jgi:hypothetical protein
MPPDVALTIGEALHNPAGTSSQGLVRGIIRVFQSCQFETWIDAKCGYVEGRGLS